VVGGAGAVAFNCYFLVATGRGAGMSDLAPAEYDASWPIWRAGSASTAAR